MKTEQEIRAKISKIESVFERTITTILGDLKLQKDAGASVEMVCLFAKQQLLWTLEENIGQPRMFYCIYCHLLHLNEECPSCHNTGIGKAIIQ